MKTPSAPAASDRPAVEEQVLSIVREVLVELGSERAAQNVRLDSALDRDLGLGSLERVEILLRAENRFSCRLPDELAANAETVNDWVGAVLSGGGAQNGSIERFPIIQPLEEAPAPPQQAQSFTEVLRRHAEQHADRVQVHLLEDDRGEDITYGQLLRCASEVAAGLAAAGLRRNETVAIMLPTCAGFFYSFFGVALAGGVAVPIYPPARASQIEEYVRRQVKILHNAEVRFLITFDRARAVAQTLRLGLPHLREVTTAARLAARGRNRAAPDAAASETFFIQYTSGSTGNPKGVLLSHANVLANVQGIGGAVQARPDDVVVSWLPLYHDMGLIGSWLFSVFYGFPITVLSPLDFLARPERWLWALSDSGGTLCPAPNFSYELCARKIAAEAIAGVDLSRWRVAINAGEPVLPDTLDRFANRFAPYGFRPESYVPCYGLAESSVALTFPPMNRLPVIDTLRRREFEREGRARPAGPGEASVLRFAANGSPLPGHEIRIVDDGGNDAPERVQGRIIFRGPSKTGGYFRNPEATAAVTLPGGWMDTGDLGYLANGELYVTGRKKDCIIKAGHNIIPQEIEMAAAETAGVRRGCVAAFGSVDAASGTEQIVVVAETRETRSAELERIEAELVRRVDEAVGMPPDVVALVPPQTVPKTSSGKIRRIETRRLYESGELKGQRRAAPWRQVARFWFENLGSATRLAARGITRRLRAAGRAFAVAAAGYGGGIVMRLIPHRGAAARFAGITCRLLIGPVSPVSLPQGRAVAAASLPVPAVLASNRSGALDLALFYACLRRGVLIGDPAMLESLPGPLAFLLEPLTVAPADGVASPPGGTMFDRIRLALREGSCVLVFSDAPIATPPHRCRFRLEAIQAARAEGMPVTPVLLSGAERLMSGLRHADEARPRVHIGEPLSPGGGGLREAVRLRDEVRAALARLASPSG